MKKKRKNIIIYILIAVVIIVCGLLYYNNYVKGNITVYNEKVKTKEYKELEFTNIAVSNNLDLNHLYIVVNNNSKKNFKREYLKFTFKDKYGKKLDTMGVMIPSISSGDSTRLDIVISDKLVDFYDFDIKEVK